MSIKYGCHGYTWQMSYEEYKDNLLHILDVIAQGGFRGIDTQVVMLGEFYNNPAKLREELDERGLDLAALTLPVKWREGTETAEEKKEADHFIDYLTHFPDALLNIVPLPEENRNNLEKRQQNILSCANAVAERAYHKGITVSFHPNSSPGSVFQYEEDYQVMFDNLNTDFIGYTPDAGHIAKGGMEPYKIFEQHRDIIKHIHFKDYAENGEWTAMGKGIINFEKIVKLLKETAYDGWIMVEEESKEAEKDPDKAMIENSKYIKEVLGF